MKKRFKIIALLIMADPIYECLDDKIAIVADAIDCKAPIANKMLTFLENSVLKINDSLLNT